MQEGLRMAVGTEKGNPRVTTTVFTISPQQAMFARGVLDREGLHATRIIVSGDLDEESIEALVASGAPVDAFGVEAVPNLFIR